MKNELKRPTKLNMIIFVAVVIVGFIFFLCSEFLPGFLFAVSGAGFLINEFIRSKDKKFTFDETGFCVGDTRYSYSDIERIESNRFRYSTYTRIIVNGTVVYRFDNGYGGAKEFVKQLTLNGVDHNLFH